MPPRRRDRFDELLALTGEVGDPVRDYVILAEGNTSARIDEGSFWVKGSGVRLEHATRPEAFVAVALEPLMAALRGDQAVGDADLKRLLAGARLEGQGHDLAPRSRRSCTRSAWPSGARSWWRTPIPPP